MPITDLQEAIDRLYAAPLEAFIPERTRLARELRASDRAAAAELARLPKPSAAAWALNHVAREARDVLGEWFASLEALRDAIDEGGDVLREAMAEHRAATARLTKDVRRCAQPSGKPLSAAMLERVRALLNAATADEELAERLRAGRVVETAPDQEDIPLRGGTRPPSGELARGSSARASSSGGAPSGRAAKPKRQTAREHKAAQARARRRAELEERAASALESLESLREEAGRHAEAADAAEGKLEEAEQTLRRRGAEAEAARHAAEQAEAEVATAERELERIHALLADAE